MLGARESLTFVKGSCLGPEGAWILTLSKSLWMGLPGGRGWPGMRPAAAAVLGSVVTGAGGGCTLSREMNTILPLLPDCAHSPPKALQRAPCLLLIIQDTWIQRILSRLTGAMSPLPSVEQLHLLATFFLVFAPWWFNLESTIGFYINGHTLSRLSDNNDAT